MFFDDAEYTAVPRLRRKMYLWRFEKRYPHPTPTAVLVIGALVPPGEGGGHLPLKAALAGQGRRAHRGGDVWP